MKLQRLLQCRLSQSRGPVLWTILWSGLIFTRPIDARTARTSSSPTYSMTQLLKDTARFDRAYIPALALTNQGQRAASQQAMQTLKTAWIIFRNQSMQANPEDALWQNDLNAVAGMIARADELVQKQELQPAHETLEGIRTRLRQLRRRNQLAYFPDVLTDFHEPMEQLVLAVKDKKVADLTPEFIQTLKTQLLPEALRAWQHVQQAKLDNAILDLPDAKLKKIPGLKAKETGSLNHLQKAVQQGDKETILLLAPAIKTNFAQLYMLFGDFESFKR